VVRMMAADVVWRTSTGAQEPGRTLSTALWGVRGPPGVFRVGAHRVCI